MCKKKLIFNYRKSREIIVGDLVYHLLYGKEWRGLLLDFIHEDTGLCTPRDMALIQMQPNSEHCNFFSKSLTKYKITNDRGYVSVRWLYRIEIIK